MRIVIFYHVGGLRPECGRIVKEQMRLLQSCGLYDVSTEIHAGVVGEEYALEWLRDYPKVSILYYDPDPTCYESRTLKCLHEHAKEHHEEDYFILYIHTKGAYSQFSCNARAVSSWRQVMGYWLIEQFRRCIRLMKDHNLSTLGGNFVNQFPENYTKTLFCEDRDHACHYSGNFWWARASHIRTLHTPGIYRSRDFPSDHIHLRMRCENWVLSQMPNMRAGECFRYADTHPYTKALHRDECAADYFRLLHLEK